MTLTEDFDSIEEEKHQEDSIKNLGTLPVRPINWEDSKESIPLRGTVLQTPGSAAMNSLARGEENLRYQKYGTNNTVGTETIINEYMEEA